MNSTLYDQDFVAWTQDQAARLRAGELDALDREHLAEEIESVGASERRELRRRIARLIQHLLEWQHRPEHRSRSGAATIMTQRDDIAALLEDSPSLAGLLPGMLPRAYGLGRNGALQETGLLNLPESCPWPAEDVIRQNFLPG